LAGAWSKGVRFLSGKAAGHAILLIGLGVAVPLLLQLLIVGRPIAFMNPPAAGGAAAAQAAAAGSAVAVATFIAYAFQLVSYFGSWRLGLARHESLGRAAGFGLLAGLIVVIGSGAALTALSAGLMQLAPAAGIVVAAIGFLLLFATFYTLLAALVAVTATLVLVLAMAFGAATGQVGLAATLVGGSGFVVVILIVVAGLLVWLAARLSCTACVMADRRGLNPFAGIAESWRLTWEEQWRIMGYLALIGLVAALVVIGGTVIAGVGLAASLRGGPSPELGIAGEVIGVLLGIPFAYLTVLVPAGIYRELAGSAAPTEVFA
jgi:hypothetical protein